ncbi:uncharacterized protein LOC101854064 [Aplysia californica]|uniref:Uncharacterized protein LOC101854064 n=1 Tax=Aplysia californica TaxID=6500 RepID=A0ABM1A703_APLCA|nr:uncharacterized protein LOC101854064 [Aplysia californica]
MMSVPYLALCMACLASVFWDARCQDAYSGNFSIENCNWGRQHVLDFAGKKVNVSIAGFAGHNLSANVTCTTNIYARNDYIHLKVSRFSLLGCSKCTPSSERLTISHAGFRTSDSITWCGETYAEELYFKGTVILEYNTGLHGEGDGFDIEVSRVTRPCVEEQTLTVTDKPRLLYSPLYPNKYPNLLNCRYKLLGLGQNLRIRSLSFDVEWKDRCLYDYLRINQVRYCGIQSIDVLETSNFNSARVHFHTDRNIGLTGYVLEYFHEHQYPVVCDGNTSLKLIELPSNESSLLIEVKINRTTKSNCTLEIDAGSDDKVLEIRTPSRQNSIDCNNVFIHTYNHSSWQFTGCPRPVSYLRTSRRTFRFMVTTTGIRREGSTGDYDVFSLHVTPLGKDILPPLLSAENTTSFVWIDKEMMRNSSQYVTHITKPSGWKCIKVQTLRFDMGQLQEYGSGSSRQSPNLMPVSDWLTVHNGRNSSYFDLTMGCGSSKSTDSQIYSKGTDVVTVSVNMRMEPKTGFWFSFQATDECTWPVIQLNGNRGKLHPRYNWKLKNLFCTWEIRKSSNSYYSTEAVKIKANNNFSMISSNRFRVFEVGRNDIKKIADVNQGSSRNMWVHVEGSARVEVEIVSAPANIPPPNIFDFEYVLFYSSPKQCGPYELKALTSPQLAYTPNYPNFYLRKTKCTWIITKDPSAKGSLLLIKFPVIICHTLTNQKVYTSSVSGSNHNWHLESTACFNGYSNKKPKSQEYRAEALKIEFESDYPYPSFNFTYGIGGCVNTLINLTDYGMSYTLHNVLPPWTQIRRDCLFRVITEPSHVIRVSFDKLSLNQDNTHYCGDNFFTVTDKCDNGNSLGKSCGAIKEKTSVTSLGNVIVIRLHTEISTSMDIVYNFTLTAVPRDPCTQRRFVYARDRRQKMDYYPSDSGK